jgi:ferredoxin
MDGSGPAAGNPKTLGMILASTDGVAMDCYLCNLLGKDPMKIPTNRIANEQGLGEGDVNKIEIIGTPQVVNDFKWPPNTASSPDMIPQSITKALMKFFWLRPAINSEICTNCNTCVKSCPVDALIKNTPHPEFKYDKCINCLCCMEMCPEKAVFENISRLFRLRSRLRSR